MTRGKPVSNHELFAGLRSDEQHRIDRGSLQMNHPAATDEVNRRGVDDESGRLTRGEMTRCVADSTSGFT
jgi:hypothetical protein